MQIYSKLSDLKAAVSAARGKAEDEARKACGRRGVLRSRGVEFVALVAGDKANEGSVWMWDGTKRGLEATLEDLQRKFPGVSEICFDGGFDWAASPRAMSDSDYDPFVSEWSISIWKKGEAA